MADAPTKEQVLTAKELREALAQLKKAYPDLAKDAKSSLKTISKEAEVLNKKIKDSKTVLDKLGIASSASFKNLINNIDDTKKTIVDLEKTKITFDKKINKVKNSVKELSVAIELGGTATKDLDKQFGDLQKSADELHKEEFFAGMKDDLAALVSSLADLPKDQLAVFSKMFDPSIQTDAKALLSAIEDIGKVKGLDTNITTQLDAIERKVKLMESIENVGSIIFGAKEGREQAAALQKALEALDTAQKTSNEELTKGIEKANTKLVDLGKLLDETANKFNTIAPSQDVLESALGDATHTIKAWEEDVNHLMEKGVPLDKAFLNIEGMRKKLNKLTAMQLDLLNEVASIANKEGATEEEKKQEIIKLQDKYNKELDITLKDMRDMQSLGDRYLASAEKSASDITGASQRWVDKLLNAKTTLAAIGKDVPVLEGLFGKLGGTIGTAAKAVGKLGASVAVFSFLGSLIKKIIDVQAHVADMYQELADTGVFIGTSSEKVGKQMADSLNKAINLKGLTSAAMMTGKEMALSRDEIVGMVKALDQGGMAARTLEAQMKNVQTTSAAASNELLGAANIVKTFSTNLGVTDAAMGDMIGNMAYQFNTTMGEMKGVFTDITNAAQQSGMSTNKFLGIIQTTTAGMAMFEDQVKSTAQMVSSLGRNTDLSGKQIEDLTKNAQGFSQDMMKAATGLALLGKAKMAELGKGAEEDLAGMKAEGAALQKKINITLAKGAAATPEEKASLELNKKSLAQNQIATNIQGKMVGFLKAGDSTNAAALLQGADAGTQLQIMAELGKKAKDMSGENYMAFRQIAKQLGISDELQMLIIGSNGKITKQMIDARKSQMKSAGEGKKSFEELQQIAIETQKKTGAAQKKAIEAIEDTLNKMVSDWGPLLEKMLLALGALYTIAKLVTLAETLIPAIEGATALAAAGFAGLSTAIGAAVAAALGVAIGYGVNELDKMLGGYFGGAVKTITGWFTGKSDAEKQFYKDWKAKGLTDEQIAKKLDEIEKGGNKVKPVKIEEMPTTPTMEPPADFLTPAFLAPAAPATMPLGPIAPAMPTAAVPTIPTAGATVPPAGPKPTELAMAGTLPGLKNVTININGGDLDRVRRVVREELQIAQNRTNRGM